MASTLDIDEAKKESALAGLRLVLIALIFVGFAARVWHLGFQSIWLDEGLSISFAGRPLRQMYLTLVYEDLHPPLFYLLLHFWMRLAGESEFAVRFVSLWLGLPAVPATYLLGAAVFSPRQRQAQERAPGDSPRKGRSVAATIATPAARPLHPIQGAQGPDEAAPTRGLSLARGQAVGTIGAFLVATSPFLVYYSQEARMYSALATFGVLSTYALWRLLETEHGRWLLGYVAFTAALMYTQYFGGLVIAFQALYLTGLGIRDRRRAIRGAIGMVLVAVLWLPWVPAAYLQMQRLFHVPDFWKGELSLSFLLEHVFAAFALGQGSILQRFLIVGILAAILLGAGIVLLVGQALRRGSGEIYVLSYLFVPLIALYAVLVQNPKFTERYLIMIAPPFYLVLALGVVDLGRWARRSGPAWVRRVAVVLPIVLLAVVVGASLDQLWQVYYGPGYRKEDNRDLTAYVEQHFQPGDVVILMMDPFSFPYYSHGTIPATQLQPGSNIQGAADSLNTILAGHKRAWLILWNPDWADPTGYVRHALESTYRQIPIGRQFNGLGLQLFEIDHPPHFTVKTTPDHAMGVNFGNRLELLGYDLERSTIAAGDSGKITLYWKPLRPLDHDYIVSLRLTDGRFYYWRHDGRPAAETYPTTSWPAGQVVAGELSFQVPPATPPGTYYLELGTYGQGAGSDLDILQNGRIPMGTAIKVVPLTVTRSPKVVDPSTIHIPNRQNLTVRTDLVLLGSTVEASRAVPGGTVDVTLWWLAKRTGLPRYDVRIALENGRYRRDVLVEEPAAGRFPTDQWTSGEVVEDRHRFVVPADAPAGQTRVLLQLAAMAGGRPLPASNGPTVDLGSIQVRNRPVVLTPPAGMEHQVDWRVGTFAELVGYTLDTDTAHPGDHLHLTLYWKALGNSGDVGFTVFCHLLDQRSTIWAQQDHQPGDGNDPTTGWIAGEYIVDRYDLAIKPDAAPGQYQIEVGMYNPATGSRLPVRAASGDENGDRVLLATVQIR
jgi:4-amino-4-deoxy-L-arabinose transferase-like glycosyltransferase